MSNGKRKNHILGPKFCKHTTVTESARKVVELINKWNEVTKISLGIIRQTKSGHFDVRFVPIHGGLTISVRGSKAIQQLHVYTSDPNETLRKLGEAFPKKTY